MLIFALMFCSSIQPPEMSCRLTNPPMVYKSLEECHAGMAPLGRPLDAQGKVWVGSNTWWQCASKHVEMWEGR